MDYVCRYLKPLECPLTCACDWVVVNQEVARPQGKRSRSGLNFFKFAETVEQGAWDDEQAKKDLEVRLTAKPRHPSNCASTTESPSCPGARVAGRGRA